MAPNQNKWSLLKIFTLENVSFIFKASLAFLAASCTRANACLSDTDLHKTISPLRTFYS